MLADHFQIRLEFHRASSEADFDLLSRFGGSAVTIPQMGVFPSIEKRGTYQGPVGVKDVDAIMMRDGLLTNPLLLAMTRAKFKELQPTTTTPFVARLWVDRNNDRKFTEDEELRAVRFGKHILFGPIRRDNNKGSELCYLKTYDFGIGTLPVGWKEGALTVGGKPDKIILIDGDYDGKYSSREDGITYHRGDYLLVGPMVSRTDWGFATFPVPSGKSMYQFVDGSFGYLSVDEAGSEATYNKVPSTGYLDVDMSPAWIRDAASEPNMIFAGSRSLAMPKGSYSWWDIHVDHIDEHGNEWRIDYYGKGNQETEYSIRAGSTTPIKLGLPVKAHSEVESLQYGVSYYAYLEDSYGNYVSEVNGPSGPVLPTLVVTDRKGSVIQRMGPDTGNGSRMSFSGGAGTYKKGMTFTVSWDLGSLGQISSSTVLK